MMEALLSYLTVSLVVASTGGYDFRNNGGDDEPILLLATGQSIVEVFSASGKSTLLLDKLREVDDVDYDFKEKKLFFVDQDKYGIFV